MNRTGTFITCLVVSAWLTGCATDPCPRILAESETEAAIKMNSVRVLDTTLQRRSEWVNYCRGNRLGPEPSVPIGTPGKRKISVTEHDSRRSPTGTMEVWTQIRNHTDYPLQVLARTRFYDKDRAPTGEATGWDRVQLPAQSYGTYRTFSTSADAEWYYIEVREQK
jgi:hypothetical protein